MRPPLTPEAFCAEVERLGGRDLGETPLALAVSGGADSLALLLLAHAAFGGRVHALTVDHGLRPESGGEAAAVGRLCAAQGVAHTTLRWEGAEPSGSLQAAARRARYRLMGDWCAAAGAPLLLTAHHAHDQAETVLMRLARGSGLPGLAGIRARRPLRAGVDLVRPLLALPRHHLAAAVAAAGIAPVDDPSNRDLRFDRTRARALLEGAAWLAPGRLAASAAHLAEAEEALDWVAGLAWDSRVTLEAHSARIDADGLPRELRRRLLLRALMALKPGAQPRGPEMDALLRRLDAGETASIAGLLARGGAIWHLAPEQPG